MVKPPNNEDKDTQEIVPLIRGAEWIGVLTAFWRVMASTFKNNGKEKKNDSE